MRARNNRAADHGTLFAAMLARLSRVIFLMTTSCIITNPTEFVSERPLTPPRIRDVHGTTQPRLGNVVVLRSTDTGVDFYVPVDDANPNDLLQWQLFINVDRDCAPVDGVGCQPQQRGEIAPDGNVRRFVARRIQENRFVVGCNRVELWVSSSFSLSEGDGHTPSRAGDVDFATWWVFKSPSDGTPVDPVESCAQRVQP